MNNPSGKALELPSSDGKAAKGTDTELLFVDDVRVVQFRLLPRVISKRVLDFKLNSPNAA